MASGVHINSRKDREVHIWGLNIYEDLLAHGPLQTGRDHIQEGAHICPRAI